MLHHFRIIVNQSKFFSFTFLVLFFGVLISFDSYAQYANIKSDSLLSLGNEIYRKGNYNESELIYKKSLEKHSKNSSGKEWIIAAVGYGASLLDQGDFNAGKHWILKADSSISQNTPLELQAYVKSNVGWVYKSFQDYEKSKTYYEHALNLAKSSGDQYRIAQVSNSLSLLSHSLGQYDNSIRYAQTAVDSFLKINDPFLLSSSYGNLSIAYESLGFIEKSEEALIKSFEIRTKLKNNDLISTTHYYLGSFYHRTGSYDKALTNYSKYLSYVKEEGSVTFITPAYDYMGTVYMSLGEFEKALGYFNSSEELRNKYSLRSNATTMSNIALSYQQLGQLDLAHDLFNKALLIFRQNNDFHSVIDTYLRLSELSLLESDFEQARYLAEAALDQSLETESKQLIAKSYAALSRAHLKINNSEQALYFARKAFDIASIFNGYRQADYLILLSETYYKTQSDSSFYYADLAFSEIEREQNNIYGDNLESGLFSKYARFYDNVAFWYLEKENNIQKAFEITERGRSRVLLERLSFAESSLDNILDEPTLMSIRQKEKNIDKIHRSIENTGDQKQQKYLQTELRNAELEYQSYTNAIRLENPSLNALEPLPIASISELQKKMTEKDAIIEYLVTENKLVAFWITESRVSYKAIDVDSLSSPTDYLSSKISAFRQAIQDQKPISELELLSEPLMERLINPFLDSAPEITQWIIIPTHSLSILPFDALYDNGKFLLEQINIKYLPSASTYNFIENPHRVDRNKILAVAGSGFNSGVSNDDMSSQNNFASLPSTLLEIEAISNEFDDYTALKNEQVTETTIKSLPLDEYRYLHFATHGNVNEKNPEQSGLIISKMNEFENSFGEDGYLNSLEISRLTLNADLVVLSACNTAIGKLVGGEGLLGLQRSFFKAGASAVVVSLWNVYDKSTSTLMGEFYTKLNEYERSELGWWSQTKIYLGVYEPPYFGYKEKALREAKLAMLNHPYYSHPVNWAPFIIIGK